MEDQLLFLLFGFFFCWKRSQNWTYVAVLGFHSTNADDNPKLITPNSGNRSHLEGWWQSHFSYFPSFLFFLLRFEKFSCNKTDKITHYSNATTNQSILIRIIFTTQHPNHHCFYQQWIISFIAIGFYNFSIFLHNSIIF